MVTYQHRQPGSLFIIILALIAVIGLLRSLRARNRLGTLLSGVAVPLGLAWLFGSLTTTVGRDAVTVPFGPGIVHRHIPLDEIDDVRSVWLPWYAGFGAHWLPGLGWLFNVATGPAVEIVTHDGDRIQVSTDDPDGLRDAILAASA